MVKKIYVAQVLVMYVPYGVYCCFVEAYAPGQLETCLSEAAQRGALQLDDQSTAEPAESAPPEREVTPPASEIQNDASELDPATLTSYSRETLRHLGAHDQARRAWLRDWAQSRGYRASWFTVHGRYSGYYQTGIPAGEEGWTRFLERGGSYDVYCLFVAALTPDIPLQRYLEDASARGEIKLGDDLLWKPR